MECVRCIRCEKFQNDFMAQTCALIAPVQPVLQRDSCSNETLPNAPVQFILHRVSCNEILPNTAKHYETHQNMSLGPNGGASVPFIAKNSDATSWNELLH